MKSPSRKLLFGLGALLLLALVIWSGFRVGSTPPRLAVVLVGVENDPISHPPNGQTVLHGGRGLCAIFAVTNIAKDASIWWRLQPMRLGGLRCVTGGHPRGWPRKLTTSLE
jgi:hypothetical protein